MKKLFLLCCFQGLVAAVSSGQTLTSNERMCYLHMLINASGVDSPIFSGAYVNTLTRRFQLNTQEVELVTSVAADFASWIGNLRTAQVAVVAGKADLSPSDISQLQSNLATRDTEVVTQANRLLSSVRPQTAGYIRAACGLKDAMHQTGAIR